MKSVSSLALPFANSANTFRLSCLGSAAPLFSCLYKSLFSQLPCFHIHTKPRGCTPNSIRKGQKMTQQTAKPSFINNSSRCTHRFANGMRCRLLTPDPDSSYCANHAAPVENQRAFTDTAASLTPDLKEFRSPSPSTTSSPVFFCFLRRIKFLPAAPRSSLTSPINSSAPFPPSTASSTPKKIPTSLPRSSLTRLARTAAKWLAPSPLTPICAHDHASRIRLTFSFVLHRT